MGRAVSRDLDVKYMGVVTNKFGVCSRCSVMTGADNQLITVRIRVRQVSADLGYINIDICRDIGKQKKVVFI